MQNILQPFSNGHNFFFVRFFFLSLHRERNMGYERFAMHLQWLKNCSQSFGRTIGLWRCIFKSANGLSPRMPSVSLKVKQLVCGMLIFIIIILFFFSIFFPFMLFLCVVGVFFRHFFFASLFLQLLSSKSLFANFSCNMMPGRRIVVATYGARHGIAWAYTHIQKYHRELSNRYQTPKTPNMKVTNQINAEQSNEGVIDHDTATHINHNNEFRYVHTYRSVFVYIKIKKTKPNQQKKKTKKKT